MKLADIKGWALERLVAMDGHTRELVEGASISFALKVVGAGLTLALNLLLAHVLGADGAGLYFLALTAVTVASVFGRMGLDNVVLRFVAASASESNWSGVKGVYRHGVRLAAIASLGSTILLWLLAPWLANDVFSDPDLAWPIAFMAVATVPISLAKLHAEMLRGLKRILYATLVQPIGGVVFPALTSAGIVFLAIPYGLSGATIGYALAAAATFLAGLALWRKSTPKLKNVSASFPPQTLLRSSMPLFWSSSINLLMTWTGTIVLGVYATSTDVGVFNVASRTAAITGFVLVAVNSIAAPKFAALYNAGDRDGLERLAQRATWMMVAAATPALLLFIAFPEPIMRIYGSEFAVGGTVLMVLAVGQFINVATGSVQYLLMMTGHERVVRNCVAISAFANVSLNLVLVPIWGIIGAAIAAAISMSTLNLLAWSLVRGKLRVDLIGIPWTALRPSPSTSSSG